MALNKKMTEKEVRQSKSERMMHTVIKRASYYRANPHRFVEELMGIHLKLFQKILIYAMMVYDYFYFIAARGLGKTYLVAIFACVRCILYPGTKIVAFSATFKQGKEIVLKITDDFMIHSPFLCNEIKRTSTGLNDCGVWFKNGSWIQVRVAGETSRGARANIIIGDEARMIPRKIYDTVMRPMNSSPRQPGYLRKPEYAHLKEMNKEFMMSSAWYRVQLWDMGIDWNKISNLELFSILIKSINFKYSQLIFGDINFSTFNLYEKQNGDEKVLILYMY